MGSRKTIHQFGKFLTALPVANGLGTQILVEDRDYTATPDEIDYPQSYKSLIDGYRASLELPDYVTDKMIYARLLGVAAYRVVPPTEDDINDALLLLVVQAKQP